ncbi:MAG TPA: hypothetical protein VNK52_14095 [Hyphomicrobiaceae bacterium]|nr:hypothetical protein [Hyphomicrobiaceae bacterium]
MSRLLAAAVIATAFSSALAGAWAENKTPGPSGRASALQEQEEHDEAARRACKVAVCAALHNRRPGKDIACSLTKSWPKEQVESVVSKARLPWPWGAVRCWGAVSLKRETLIKAMTEPRYEAVIERHTVSCEVEREKGNSEVRVELAPKVTFENGKAVAANLGWGKIEASGVVKGAVWAMAAADKTLRVFESTVVEKVNEFVSTKCDEVRSEWQNK